MATDTKDDWVCSVESSDRVKYVLVLFGLLNSLHEKNNIQVEKI